MRIYKQFSKSIALTGLLVVGFAAMSIAQDTTTIATQETTMAPVILSTSPTGGEMNVDLGSVIKVTFSSEMDENSINGTTFQLRAIYTDTMQKMHNEMMQDDQKGAQTAFKDSINNQQNTTGTVNGTISYSNKVAVFTPDEKLKEGTLYTFTATTGVKSSENVALENDKKLSFISKGTPNPKYSENQSDNQDDGYKSDMKEIKDSSKFAMKTDKANEAYNSGMKETKDSSKFAMATDTANKMYNSRMEEIKDSSKFAMTTDKANEAYKSGMEETTEDSSKYAMVTDKTTNKISEKTKMIDLGKAGNFVILAKKEVNNESGSEITGQVGEGSVANGTKKEEGSKVSTTGQSLVKQSSQKEEASPNADVNEAIKDMMSAYADASLEHEQDITTHNTDSFHHDSVLKSGVHAWNDSLNVTSDVTLSGSEDDVWIFKTDKDLTVKENTVFTLTDGAQADNIFWYVEGEVTIGKDAQFEGIILSMNDITLEKGAKLNGRMFSQTSITLDDNTVNEPRSMGGQTTSKNK